MTITFNWRDLWVGVYVSKRRDVIWVCLIPCVAIGIRIKRRSRFTLDEWLAKWNRGQRTPEQ